MTRKFVNIFYVAVALLFIHMGLAGTCVAETFTVYFSDDSVDVTPGDGVCADSEGKCTLRAAIMEANALPGADVIHIPAGGSVLLLDPVDGSDDSAAGGDLDVTDDLTIIGGGAKYVTINGAWKYRVFDIRATVIISGVTITRGLANGSDGGGIVNSGTLTISDSVISQNIAKQSGSSGGDGGGIYNNGYYTSASLTLINSIVKQNTTDAANGSGAGIYNRKEGDGVVTLTVVDSEISSNGDHRTATGGGISSSGSLEVINSLIRNNLAREGAGLWIGGPSTIAYSTIKDNYAR